MDSSPSRFKAVYFLNNKGTRFEAHAIRELIEPHFPDIRFMEPLVPGQERETLIHYLLPFILPDSLVVGLGVDGLIACYLQEEFPVLNMSVIAVNSPTGDGWMNLQRNHPQNRVALYSSLYEPNRGRNHWTGLAEIDLDVAWLQHGVFSDSGANLSKYAVAYYVTAYMQSPNLEPAVASFPAQ